REIMEAALKIFFLRQHRKRAGAVGSEVARDVHRVEISSNHALRGRRALYLRDDAPRFSRDGGGEAACRTREPRPVLERRDRGLHATRREVVFDLPGNVFEEHKKTE